MRFVKGCVLILLAASALTACAKSNNSTAESQTSNNNVRGLPASEMKLTGAPGEKTFMITCASCHQRDGKGLTGVFPPLAGNPLVTGDPHQVIYVVKYGLTGKVMVGPDQFNGIMPPWGSSLPSQGLADVVNYIRTSWGNSASPVTAADVDAVKK